MSGKGISPDPSETAPAKSDPPFKDILEKAVAAHTLGRFDEAERLYRQVLEIDADEPNALTNLGTIALQRGRLEDGIPLIEASLKIKPNQANALTNLGNALTTLRRFNEALDVCERAVALQPTSHDAFNNLGNVRRELEQYDEALAAYESALALKPDFAVVMHNKANLLRLIGRLDEALITVDRALALQGGNLDTRTEKASVLMGMKRGADALAIYEDILAHNPDSAESWNNKAAALHMLKRFNEAERAAARALEIMPDYPGGLFNRANALHALQRDAEAVADLERAIALQPDYGEAYNNLGISLQALGRSDEALLAYERCQALRKDLAPAWANRGFVLRDLGRYAEALEAYDHALTIDPALQVALNDRGLVLHEMNRFDEALTAFDNAIAAAPDMADAYWNKALSLILREHYLEGWALYEHRWLREELQAQGMPFLKPDWLQTTQVAGKTVLVRAEQGLGDTLQMLRYVPMLADLGAKVVLAVQAPLGELARTTPGVGMVIVEGEAFPPFDAYCMTMSLPMIFDTTVDTVPAPIPYISVSETARQAWVERLGPKTRPRVGIAWSGSRGHKNDHNRSIPLNTLLPILEADVEFVSLQIEYREADESLMQPGGHIRDFAGDIRSFMDTAALIEQMDLVISVDTSVAHLAGALGAPLWLLLPRTPDYRWHLEREDTPWYPNARLFRQPKVRDWDSVVARMAQDLKARFA